MPPDEPKERLNIFERYLTLWVFACIGLGTALGRFWPELGQFMARLSVAQVSLPIAVALFFMMYPIMVKIDFSQVIKAGKTPKPVALTLVVNWGIKPFTMAAIATLFLGYFFRPLIGGSELIRGEEVALFRSYISGAILLGIAPCTAMVFMWSYLAKGNDGHTLIMVAINSLTMLVLYAPLGGFLLKVNGMPMPWRTLFLAVGLYVGLPLMAGYFSRKEIIKRKGEVWFRARFIQPLTTMSIVALLFTLVLLFAYEGEILVNQPYHVLLIAVPLFIQTCLIFALTYFAARVLGLRYEDAAPSAMIGASNHFEVAIATAVILFGINSGVALATVVGVLIEVPLMLTLVGICKRSKGWFKT